MGAHRLELIWDGEVVGSVENPKPDMFHLYGKWIPADTEKAREFLAALKVGEDEGVPVLLAGDGPKSEGEASLYSGDQINILVRPRS